MLPLHSTFFPQPPWTGVFAFCLGLPCAAKAGQSGCKTAPGSECTQVFKVFPCKFRVPALSTEPISGTVVKEGLHCQGPGARVKTRSVLWSLVPLRYGQQPSTLMFSSPIPLRGQDRGTQSILLLSNVGFELCISVASFIGNTEMSCIMSNIYTWTTEQRTCKLNPNWIFVGYWMMKCRHCYRKYSKRTHAFWPRLCWHDVASDVLFSCRYKNIKKKVCFSFSSTENFLKLFPRCNAPSICRAADGSTSLFILKLLNLSFYSGKPHFLPFFSFHFLVLSRTLCPGLSATTMLRNSAGTKGFAQIEGWI